SYLQYRDIGGDLYGGERLRAAGVSVPRGYAQAAAHGPCAGAGAAEEAVRAVEWRRGAGGRYDCADRRAKEEFATMETVRNSYCIGRNDALRAKELGNAVPEAPLVFLKPTQALVPCADRLVLPGNAGEMHHEAEIVLLMAKP